MRRVALVVANLSRRDSRSWAKTQEALCVPGVVAHPSHPDTGIWSERLLENERRCNSSSLACKCYIIQTFI